LFGSYRDDKQNNKQTPLKTSNALCCTMMLGKSSGFNQSTAIQTSTNNVNTVTKEFGNKINVN